MALNENIRKFRKEAGLTQKELAGKSGLSFSMISKLESGNQKNPSFETIRKIAEVLTISPGNLVNVPLTIEEQIDDYINYKRGLTCSDLNFKRKLQAINGIPVPSVPSDEASDEYGAFLKQRPEMKKLFFVLRNASKEEINQITRLVQAFKGGLG